MRNAAGMTTSDRDTTEKRAEAGIKHPLVDWIRASATGLVLVWLIYAGGAELGYNWQWYRVPPYLFTIAEGPGSCARVCARVSSSCLMRA